MPSAGIGKAWSLTSEAVQKRQLRLSSTHWNVLASILRGIIYRCIFRSMNKRYWTCYMWKMRQVESKWHEDCRELQGGPNHFICLPQSLHDTNGRGWT